MQQKKLEPRQPSWFWYTLIVATLGTFLRVFHGLKIDRKAIAGMKPPYIVLSSHPSILDFLITAVSLYPMRLNYVTAFFFFTKRWMSWFLHKVGAIPKLQFLPDLKAMRAILNVVRNGGGVSIYPAGQNTLCGVPGYIPRSIAKLVKKLNVPVIGVHIDGAYLACPKWSKLMRYGRIEARVFPMFSKEELGALNLDTIYNRICEDLYYDDSQWQRKIKKKFFSWHRAQGLSNLLYKCPQCHVEFSMSTKGQRLSCQKCGNRVYYDVYGFLHAEGEGSVAYETTVEWFKWQRDCIERELVNEDCHYEEKAVLKAPRANMNGYESIGEGVIKLGNEGFSYDGTMNGEKAHLFFPAENVPVLRNLPGSFLEVPCGEGVHRFVPLNRKCIVKWVIATEVIYEKTGMYAKD